MFAKKESAPSAFNESVKCIRARDVGLPYTKLSVVAHYTMSNNHEYTTTKKLYLLNYTSYPTAKEAMEAFYNDFLDVQKEYREQLIKNFGKYGEYMRFGDTFVRSDQCILAYITCEDDSYNVKSGFEETPSITGWPWEEGSYHAD